MMQNSRTYYQLILDRSGSMQSCIEETMEGINTQITQIKELDSRYSDQQIVTSLTIFNQNITPVWNRLNCAELRELTYSDYVPNGTTALYDAIGLTIRDLQDTVAEELDAGKASVVVVIITDGYENTSKYFNRKSIAEMIENLQRTEKWIFSYIGSTIDAVEIAISLNIDKENSMCFKTSESVNMYKSISGSLKKYIRDKSKYQSVGNKFLSED